MAFLEKAKEVLTGKSKTERLQEKDAYKIMRSDVNTARLKARKEEAVKFAIESERHKYSQRLKRLKQPRQPLQQMDIGGMFKQPRAVNQPSIQTKKSKKKKGSKKKRVQKIVTPPAQHIPQKRFNVISGRWE